MKPGTRALGIAESTADDHCLLCGAVVRADRAVDGVGFASATVGGLDATDAVLRLLDRLDRDDIRYLLVSGVAPAWFNLLNLDRIAEAADRPVCSVSYEASPGLAPAIHRAFDGDGRAKRLAVYDRLPPRRRVGVNGETVFVRSVGLGNGDAAHHRDDGSAPTAPAEVARVIRAYTPAGGRPEPVRVARLVARGGQAWRAGDADRHG
ncbi:DUF99 family protein [Halobellus salinus]|uniref:endonuclease dU n=1 Tax=Halobellus salinus TaxID=931585 RepID=UPI00166F252F|nr:DUF99 family protein [Halobellus salinus]